MRTAPLLLAALTLGAAAAAMPVAASEPICMTGVPCLDPGVETHCWEQEYGTAGDTVTLHPDCTVDVETGKGIVCVGAWTATDEYELGPVHWTRHYCSFPGGDPVCCLDGASSTASYPCTCPPPQPLCRPITEAIADNDDAVDFTLTEYCRVTVTVDVTEVEDCGTTESTTVTRGPVTLVLPECIGPCTCPPPTLPIVVEAPPVAPCDLEASTPYVLQRPLWGDDSGCDVDVEPIGACAPPSGFVVERDVLFVHLHVLVCDGGLGGRLGDLIQPWS